MTLTLDRPTPTLRTAQLELTGRCQLSCSHCFTSSSPTASHGTMTTDDWNRVVDELADLGVPAVQLIGGEPTTSPAFEPVLERALLRSMKVEVYTNMIFPNRLWNLLEQPGVTLATSYYDAQPAVHDQVTGRTGSHRRTRAQILEALRRGIPIRIGIVEVLDSQDVDAARAELVELGLPEGLIRVDRMRQVGRGAGGTPFDAAELCGACGDGRAAVLPDGTLAPCVMGRALVGGDVRNAPLAELLAGDQWATAVAAVPRRAVGACTPKTDGSDCHPTPETCHPATDCNPQGEICGPSRNIALTPVRGSAGCTPHDGSDCDPSGRTACVPDFDDAGA